MRVTFYGHVNVFNEQVNTYCICDNIIAPSLIVNELIIEIIFIKSFDFTV